MNNKEAPIEKITIVVNGKEIVLDPENLKYNENTLGDYMSREYGWVDYFGKQLEYAQKEATIADIDSDAIFSLKMIESKDLGNSDNYAKSYALSHPDVVAARKRLADCKENVGHLRAHLKAWDKSHENTQNVANTRRTEMKMLNRDIYSSNDNPDDNTCCAEDFLNKD